MARYIDMDKLTARLPVVGVDGTDPLVSVADIRLIIAFAAAETRDVAEVVHASWEWCKANGRFGYYCTNCKAGFSHSPMAKLIALSHDYCPKCGAKMDGKALTENQ